MVITNCGSSILLFLIVVNNKIAFAYRVKLLMTLNKNIGENHKTLNSNRKNCIVITLTTKFYMLKNILDTINSMCENHNYPYYWLKNNFFSFLLPLLIKLFRIRTPFIKNCTSYGYAAFFFVMIFVRSPLFYITNSEGFQFPFQTRVEFVCFQVFPVLWKST